MIIDKKTEALIREAFEAGQEQTEDAYSREHTSAIHPQDGMADYTVEDLLTELRARKRNSTK